MHGISEKHPNWIVSLSYPCHITSSTRLNWSLVRQTVRHRLLLGTANDKTSDHGKAFPQRQGKARCWNSGIKILRLLEGSGGLRIVTTQTKWENQSWNRRVNTSFSQALRSEWMVTPEAVPNKSALFNSTSLDHWHPPYGIQDKFKFDMVTSETPINLTWNPFLVCYIQS